MTPEYKIHSVSFGDALPGQEAWMEIVYYETRHVRDDIGIRKIQTDLVRFDVFPDEIANFQAELCDMLTELHHLQMSPRLPAKGQFETLPAEEEE